MVQSDVPADSGYGLGPSAGADEETQPAARGHRGARTLANALLAFALIFAIAGVEVTRRGRPATGDVVQLVSGPKASNWLPVPEPLSGSADVASAPLPLEPAGVRIEAAGVSAPTVPVGLAPDGSLAVPPPGSTGWYSLGVRPGEAGYAVIAGHVDNHRGPDVFYRLHGLQTGDVVAVHDADGRELKFVVESIEQHAKAALPTTRMWGTADRPMLALVTCGGSFDRRRRTYADNVVVYASLSTSSTLTSQ